MTESCAWKDGILTNAIKNGTSVVLDSLDSAPAELSEMLVDLIDSPELNPKFKLIATSNEANRKSFPSSLLNRLNVIYLDDQLADLTEEQRKDFVQFLLDNELSESMKLIAPFDLNDKLVNLITNEGYNMARISKTCKAIAKLLPYCHGVESSTLISFVNKLFDSNCKEFAIPSEKVCKDLLKIFL